MSGDTSRRLILHMSLSLDGFAAHRNHELDWLTPEEGRLPDHGAQRHRMNLELLSQVGLIVMGRGAYEEFFKGWGDSDNPMARLMNSLPKLVFSQSLPAVEWNNATLTRRPLAEEIPERKAEGGKDIVVFGGARIANSLIRERLVDEYRLTIHPVALGDGLLLMHGIPEPQRFEMVSSTAYADGSLAQVLRPL
ncbi:MAG TPA: dihydrofolate reductase family protein [Solirubrobacterales bacterium]|jgi:dihydrofolate reductase|nr:dihydrofolate reductase family protein [Solirubrobacterales bacterium]